jgi:hydrogenase maturation protein HypF
MTKALIIEDAATSPVGGYFMGNDSQCPVAERIRVRGLVQGVGFRPTVWRLARDLGLAGDVRNDGEGVLIRARAGQVELDAFCRRLVAECPVLARIDALEREPLREPLVGEAFQILASGAGRIETGVVADAAICADCAAELADPGNRRYRYPFANCTHCGPRLSIVRAIPYDRANTSMAAFPLCPDCRREYQDPADRRFHAQPIACPVCGPRVWLEDREGRLIDPADLGAEDAVAAASLLLAQGRILAIKGIGGFHLACDAGNAVAVAALRQRKGRYRKPFALMARDLEVIRRYAHLNKAEEPLLASPAAPVVLLEAVMFPEAVEGMPAIAPEIAPGQTTLGFMLPYSPLHRLLLQDWDRPLVMTSGNRSEEPQCLDNAEARQRLAGLADALLLHDRDILNRVDDAVLRVMDGAPRPLRRARGLAPAPIPLPVGFEDAPAILALGGELKNTLCLLRPGQAILSQHLGDLEDARTAAEFERTLALYQQLFQHEPVAIALDPHPDYRSTLVGRALAADRGIEVIAVQHHFAHIASVLADAAWPLAGDQVLGLAFDGLGWGEDGTLWGGEFLVADYRGWERLGHLCPVPMPGGVRAIREPWRNLYAQIATCLGWETFAATYPELELTRYLAAKPLPILDTMMARGLNSPLTSSCGRLFDAVAAALGLCRDGIAYEGQAAIELETLARMAGAGEEGGAYPMGLAIARDQWQLDPAPMWAALLKDLASGREPGVMAARFHLGLAQGTADLATRIATARGLDSIALSGGVFQNKTLFEAIAWRLRQQGLRVLTHRQVPANDGGLSLGQAVVAAARLMGLSP